LQRYHYAGNNTAANWGRTIDDLGVALNGGSRLGILMQAKVTSRNDTGRGNNTLVQATGQDLEGQIRLPWDAPDGTRIFLGDPRYPDLSYPPNLYPNFTYGEFPVNNTFSRYEAYFDGYTLNADGHLLLGPWAINDTFALASLTVPVINNTSSEDILAWMTVVVDSRMMTEPITAQEGLDSTGVTMLVAPADPTNMLPPGVYNSTGRAPDDFSVRYVIPPNNTWHRHNDAMESPTTYTFDWTKFPAVKRAWSRPTDRTNQADAILSTHNEENIAVGVGYALIPAEGVVDWMLIVEQNHKEVYEPITHLRNVLLACVFGTGGFVLLMVIPIAHFGTAPIRRLRDATRNSVAPPGYLDDNDRLVSPDGAEDCTNELGRKEGFFGAIARWRQGSDQSGLSKEENRRRRQFKIPAKVKDRKHYIHDELTDLTKTFNEMSDELMVNYERLEERVQQRTIELEESKRAAEAANEAKTLFVANISHELKTPLNGILGIAQISQVETSLAVLKRDMRIIYNQGDLLTKLIQDLLLFSKNQVDHQIGLEEGDFRVRDITTQVLSTFQVQASDSGINLVLEYEGPNDGPTADSTGVNDRKEFGPFGTGRVKDMVLWGDKTRLLQVVNNLTSNALKFTPSGGSVRIIVRCLGEEGSDRDLSRKGSVMSKQNSISKASLGKGSGRNSRQLGNFPSNVSEKSSEMPSASKINTAIEINALDRHTPTKDRTSSPPIGSRAMLFEWEVQDTGPGMSLHVQEKVFEPFFQGDMALSKKFQGTGLGLSICAQLAKLMGGGMALHSEEGKGSTFTLRVPLKQVGSRADSTASSTGTGSVRYNSPRNSISGDSILPENLRSDMGAIDTRSTRSLSTSSRMYEGSSVHGKPYTISERGASSTTTKASTAPPINADSIKDPNPSPPSPGAEVRSLKVLVAEDNSTNQIVVTRLLKMEKITDVQIAEDGQIAHRLVMESMAKGDNFDLIFMDVQVRCPFRILLSCQCD
jgi:osomolarity two-component system sensor histidine kinase SLN1